MMRWLPKNEPGATRSATGSVVEHPDAAEEAEEQLVADREHEAEKEERAVGEVAQERHRHHRAADRVEHWNRKLPGVSRIASDIHPTSRAKMMNPRTKMCRVISASE